MNYILFDFHEDWENLLPLTYTRPISEIRIGIMTLKEKWDKLLDANCSYLSEEYLQIKFQSIFKEDNIYINASIIPNRQIVNEILKLKSGQSLTNDDELISFRTENEFREINSSIVDEFNPTKATANYSQLKFPWDIFRLNGAEIESDYYLLTTGRTSANISSTNGIIGENIFLEEGVIMEFATINAKNAFVYIAKNAEIMEGA
ncbi:MAG: glucose-1-phosphate thymidylyltransferase, partial [Bacteroidetes bacterium]